MLEIEKRYRLNPNVEIPKDKIKLKYRIEQVYSNIAIATSPDVRIRKITKDEEETYFHTVKYTISKQSKIREEIEQPITKEQYDRIFEYINKKPILKDRALIELSDGLVAEIDCFLDTKDTIIEVEFIDENQMNSFEKPNWFGEEIKNKQSYSTYVFSKINENLNSVDKLRHYLND